MLSAKRLLGALVGLSILLLAEGVEVCRVSDLQLVTQSGEFFLGAMFLVMGVSTVIFTMMAFKADHEKRTFFFCACYITAVSSFAYYAMLSGQAWLITTNCRQFFYVRFLEWAATTPLILLALGSVAGADSTYILAVMGGDVMMIFGFFMSSITDGQIKWLWFALTMLVFAPILLVMLVSFRGYAAKKHPSVSELYTKLSWLSVISWSLYPITFALSVLSNDWSPNFEIMIYAVLDIFSKVAFCFIMLLSHEALEYASGLAMFTSDASSFAKQQGLSYGTQPMSNFPPPSKQVHMRSKGAVESYI